MNSPGDPEVTEQPFLDALNRVLRPLARAMIEQRIGVPALVDRLKETFVAVASEDYRLEGKLPTDSRVSLLTGLQRRDVKAVRERLADGGPAEPERGGGYFPRVIARWRGDDRFRDGAGQPLVLSRVARDEKPSFEELVAAVSQDMHARTVLDEMRRSGMVEWDEATDTIQLLAEAYTPHWNQADLLHYFGANLGDHAEAAVANVMAGPGNAPFFERAVHYNQLTPESRAELDALARDLQMEALQALSDKALQLQEQDKDKPDATERFRCGGFIYWAAEKPGKDDAE